MSPYKPQPHKRIRRSLHGLPELLGAYTLKDLCQELDQYPTVEAFVLMALRPQLPGPNRRTSNVVMAFANYLRESRPEYRQHLEATAQRLAKAWPANWTSLPFGVHTAYRHMLRIQFTRAVTHLHSGLTAPEWAEMIWPTAQQVLASRPQILHLTPSEGALEIADSLTLPTRAQNGGVPIYKPILRELRARLRALIRQQADEGLSRT